MPRGHHHSLHSFFEDVVHGKEDGGKGLLIPGNVSAYISYYPLNHQGVMLVHDTLCCRQLF